MIKKLFGSLALVILSISLSSQELVISGTVIDQQTGEPLTGATIKHPVSGVEVITDFDGFFTISAPDKGINELTVTYVSYEKMKLNRVVVREGEATKLNIKMRRLGSDSPKSSFMASRDNQPQA
jgi:iron complex outermembrane receptor protein